MHWYVYSMWVFRVETLPAKYKDDGEPLVPKPRFIDIEFSPDYKLCRSHKQRIATEFRVPLYEGFTMPPSTHDSETAAMFKSLLLRSLSVENGDQPEDIRFAKAFDSLCAAAHSSVDGNHAFTKAWLAHVEQQRIQAAEAARRFLDRYEYMSLWETQEIQDELNAMWEEAQENEVARAELAGSSADPGPSGHSPDGESRRQDPDVGKPRATVKQYAALIGQKVICLLYTSPSPRD